jgi:alpha-L-arabinofuranosidase
VTLKTQVSLADGAAPKPGVYALGGRDEKSGQIIIKAVNPGSEPLDTTIRIEGAKKLKPKARVITLAGEKPTDENTLDKPNQVVPVESLFEGVGPEFRYTLKPYSLTILRIDPAG